MAQKAIVGEKVGMTQVWDDQNRVVPVTVLKVTPCRVVQVKRPDTDGYSALQVTYGTKKTKSLTKPELGHFEKAGDGTPRLVRALLARRDEEAGHPDALVRGMPLGYPSLSPEEIQLVESWVAQGRPR